MIDLQKKVNYSEADEKELFLKHKLNAANIDALKKRINGFFPKLTSEQSNEILLLLCDILPYEASGFKSSLLDMIEKSMFNCGPLQTDLLENCSKIYSNNIIKEPPQSLSAVRDAFVEIKDSLNMGYEITSFNSEKEKAEGRKVLEENLRKYGLLKCFETKYPNDITFQTETAPIFKNFLADYIEQKKRKPPVPSLFETHKDLILAGRANPEAEAFVPARIRKSYAWLSANELSMLSDLLGINFFMKDLRTNLPKNMPPQNLRNDSEEDPIKIKQNLMLKKRCNVVVLYTGGHYDAEIDGKKVHAYGNGDCSFNSFSLGLRAALGKAPALKYDQRAEAKKDADLPQRRRSTPPVRRQESASSQNDYRSPSRKATPAASNESRLPVRRAHSAPPRSERQAFANKEMTRIPEIVKPSRAVSPQQHRTSELRQHSRSDVSRISRSPSRTSQIENRQTRATSETRGRSMQRTSEYSRSSENSSRNRTMRSDTQTSVRTRSADSTYSRYPSRKITEYQTARSRPYSSPSRRNSLSVERRKHSEERPSTRPGMPNSGYKDNGTQALFRPRQNRSAEGLAANTRAGFPSRVNPRADNSSYTPRHIRGH